MDINYDLEHLNIGLVLSGGGAKGAYEVGVFKALWELDLVDNIKVVSGTSIGSVNALFLAMNDKEILNSGWSSLSYSRFIHKQESIRIAKVSQLINRVRHSENRILEELKISDIGLLSQSGIENFIDDFVDIETVRKSEKDIYACTYNIDKERPEYFKLDEFSEEDVKKIVLASCAVPYIFKPITFNGNRYADGGINAPQYSKNNVDNVPITPLKSYDCDLIIVVHLSYKNPINRNEFKDSNVIEIFPSSSLEPINGIGTIILDHQRLMNNIELGYRDAMVILAPIIINLIKGKDILHLIDKNDESNNLLVKKNKIFD